MSHEQDPSLQQEARRRLEATRAANRILGPLPVCWDEVEEMMPGVFSQDEARRFLNEGLDDLERAAMYEILFTCHPGLKRGLTPPVEPVKPITHFSRTHPTPQGAGEALEAAGALVGRLQGGESDEGRLIWRIQRAAADCQWDVGDASLAEDDTVTVVVLWDGKQTLEVAVEGFATLGADKELTVEWLEREGTIIASAVSSGYKPARIEAPEARKPLADDQLRIRHKRLAGDERSPVWNFLLRVVLGEPTSAGGG